MNFKLRHVLASLILHGVLFAFLVGGVQCSRPPQRPPVIQAVLLDPSREETSAQKRKQEQERKRKEEQKRKEQERREREEAERERIAEQKRVADAQKKIDEAKKEKELVDKKKAEEARRTKKEEAARKEKEKDKRRQAEAQESLEQAVQEEQLQRQLDREQEGRRKTEQDAAVNQWIVQVTDKVRRNWIRPPNAPDKFECWVQVQQLPGGQVTNARISESCGNPALDDSVVKAVLRSDPLPTISDPSLFSREFTIRFVP